MLDCQDGIAALLYLKLPHSNWIWYLVAANHLSVRRCVRDTGSHSHVSLQESKHLF